MISLLSRSNVSASSPLLISLLIHSTNKLGGISRSFSSSSPSSSSSWRNHDEESRNIKVSVWWDFENCNVPCGVNVFKVAQRITSALRANGIKGPITITAFGDFLQISKPNQEALSMTGVRLNHVPRGGKNSADRSLLVDLMCWVSQNPPPAHLFLISGDTDFANIMHRLRMNNYNVLLASSEPAPGVLCSTASIMWPWNHLVRGENISGKHFAQPPDGPYGSWYGYYRGPLDEPFSDLGQPACSQAEDPSDPSADSKPQPVPKALVNHIRQILNLYPKGINISELRVELARSNMVMDKEFFGYKKFSLLLKSLSTILSLKSAGDGQLIVHGVQPKVAEPVVLSPRLATGLENNAGNGGSSVKAELNGRNNVVTAVSGKPSSVSNFPPKEETAPLNLATEVSGSFSSPSRSPPKEEPPPLNPKNIDALHTEDPKTIDAPPTEDRSISIVRDDSVSEAGFFQRIWRTWFPSGSDDSCKKSSGSFEKCPAGAHSIQDEKIEENSVDSASGPDSSVSSLSPSKLNVSVFEEKTITNPEVDDHKSNTLMGYFNQIVNWWCGPTDGSAHCCNEVNQIKSQTEDHELFSRETFWDDMGKFVTTPTAASLISQSRTREEMAQQLQRKGPVLLHTLGAGDILRLVDLLISEKKWVGESVSQACPFKLNLSGQRCSSPSKPPGLKGLSSIFSATSAQSDSQRPPNQQRGNEYGNNTQTGACSAESNKKPSGKSNSEILADCQKLVGEILVEHSEGFNIASFRDLFLERYGYALAYRKLGYHKLAALLQTVPGVRIEHSFVLPARRVPENIIPYMIDRDEANKVSKLGSEFTDSRGTDDQDCMWKELGPVSEKISSKNGDSKLKGNGRINEKMECVDFDEASYLSDDFSDAEGESCVKDRLEGEGAFRNSDEDSSLLQILDSWYTKDENGSNCPSKCSSVSGGDDSLVSSSGRKATKPRKNYSFVSDTEGDKKEKLIDNILGSLKKSSESKVQT